MILEIILGILAIIAAIFMAQLLAMTANLVPTALAEMDFYKLITENVIIPQILYGTGGILLILGALMLLKNETTGKIIIIIGSVPILDKIGIFSLIIAFVFVKKEK